MILRHDRLLLSIAVALLAACGPVEHPDLRPNIVLVLADDVGYSDIGCFGGEINTPNLDRLAGSGLRFSRYYSSDMGRPGQASLLTGVYSNIALDGQKLRPEALTIAEMLGETGYQTYMAGQWRLSPGGAAAEMPLERGFGQFYGTLAGAFSYFAPASLIRGTESAAADYARGDFYLTDAVTDAAVEFVEAGAKSNRPFFLHVAYPAMGGPLQALPGDIARYEGRYESGWDELRSQRHQRMKDMGLVDPEWGLSARYPSVPAWERVPDKTWQQRRMEVYAAQIDRMDHDIGRLVQALEQTGEMDNTVFVFQSDNGAGYSDPEPGGANIPETTRDGRPVQVGNTPDVMPGPEDTFQSYGAGWANVSNTPFRRFKGDSHEGGIRVPLIIHWPGRVAEPGSITAQVAHAIDLTPTLLDAARVAHPVRYQGHRVLEIDGSSLIAVIEGEQRRAHDALFWKWAEGRAVRRDRWKMVATGDQPWELYDIEADGTELDNIAAENPDVTAGLERLWQAWDSRTAAERLTR